MSGVATCFFVPGRETGEGNGKIAPQILRLLQENNQVDDVVIVFVVVIMKNFPQFFPKLFYFS